MPKKKEYKVGERIEISLNGRIHEAIITAVVERSEGLRLQLAFFNDQTALVHEWQVVQERYAA